MDRSARTDWVSLGSKKYANVITKLKFQVSLIERTDEGLKGNGTM